VRRPSKFADLDGAVANGDFGGQSLSFARREEDFFAGASERLRIDATARGIDRRPSALVKS